MLYEKNLPSGSNRPWFFSASSAPLREIFSRGFLGKTSKRIAQRRSVRREESMGIQSICLSTRRLYRLKIR
jgi:hypothetical protein